MDNIISIKQVVVLILHHLLKVDITHIKMLTDNIS
jgi:hypothetical protein